jgi:hypothetical protein
MPETNYNWKRYWHTRESDIGLDNDGFLPNPDDPYEIGTTACLRTLDEFREFNCLILLGEPGIGKTTSLEAEIKPLKCDSQIDIIHEDLGCYEQVQALSDKIFDSKVIDQWKKGNGRLFMFLDGFDECRIQIDTLAKVLSRKLLEFDSSRLFLRITSRTASWHCGLETELKSIFKGQSLEILELSPLRKIDVLAAIASENIDSELFFKRVHKSRAIALAIRPITLKFLIGIFKESNDITASGIDLYEAGCALLCKEPNRLRQSEEFARYTTSEERLEIAKLIAGFCSLSNKLGIESYSNNHIKENDYIIIDRLVKYTGQITRNDNKDAKKAVIETLNTGLFSSGGRSKLRFSHKSYQEYLAANFLKSTNLGINQLVGLITHPEDAEKKVIPQLSGLAIWLSTMNNEFKDWLLEYDPGILLSSEPFNLNTDLQKAIVEQILRFAEEGRLIPRESEILEQRLFVLNYPDISKQLKNYIIGDQYSEPTKRMGIKIAAACMGKAQEDLLLNIALHDANPIRLRIDAAREIKNNGSPQGCSQLKQVLQKDIIDDPEEELKGIALLAVWPDYITAGEMLKVLTMPRKEPFLGSYHHFANYIIPKTISNEDLPEFLIWIARQVSVRKNHHPFAKLIDSIMVQAWNNIDIPDILNPFARATIAMINNHRKIFKEYPAGWGDPKSSETNSKRRRLLRKIINLIKVPSKNLEINILLLARLIFEYDIPWLLEQLQKNKSENHKVVHATLIRHVFSGTDSTINNRILIVCEKDTILHKELNDLIGTVELNSSKAKRLKENYSLYVKYKGKDKQKALLDPPPKVRIQHVLDSIEKGKSELWKNLVLELFLRPDSKIYNYEAIGDLTRTPGWSEAAQSTRERIIRAAFKYLTEQDPNAKSWIMTQELPGTMLNGYDALRLIQKVSDIDDLSEDIWGKWIPSILCHPIGVSESADDIHLNLVKMAYKKCPDDVISTLYAMIEKDNAAEIHVFNLGQVKRCWDFNLALSMRRKMQEKHIKPSCMGNLLGELLKMGDLDSKQFAGSLLASVDFNSEENVNRAISAGWAILKCSVKPLWDLIWIFISHDLEICRKFFLRRRQIYEFKERALIDQLSVTQIKDLYILLVNAFPYAEDPDQMHSGYVTPRMEVERIRDYIPSHLSRLGNRQACHALEEITKLFPQYEFLKKLLAIGRDNFRRGTWLPPSPEDLFQLIKDSKKRFVESGEQLLDVIMESLNMLQDKLHGSNNLVELLWNQKEDGEWNNKKEISHSKFIAQHLEDDMKDVMVHREVEINRDKTDIYVSAISKDMNGNFEDRISVLIEVKGCWHDKLCTAMKNQLLEKYLNVADVEHGIYLVIWCHCDKWNNPRGPMTGKTIEFCKEHLEKQASIISEESGKNIGVFILDTHLD